MSDAMRVEETVPGYHIVYVPNANKRNQNAAYRMVKPIATIEQRCGRWLWQLRDESAIGLCDSMDEARDAVTVAIRGKVDAFIPPTAAEAREVADAYCQSRGIDPAVFDEAAFIGYYECAGWTISKGNRPPKDWKNAVRSWIRREAEL